MKRMFSMLLVAATVAAFHGFATPVMAQSAGGNIAVIDIPKVFKEHALFNKQKGDLEAEVKAAEAEGTKTRDQLRKMAEELQSFKPGSPDYKMKEEELARVQSDATLKVNRIRREIMEREAKLYFTTYTQIREAVSVFAQRHNIVLVLRHNSGEIDSSSPQSIMEGVHRSVIFENQIDITHDILRMMNNGVPQNAGVPGTQVPVRR